MDYICPLGLPEEEIENSGHWKFVGAKKSNVFKFAKSRPAKTVALDVYVREFSTSSHTWEDCSVLIPFRTHLDANSKRYEGSINIGKEELKGLMKVWNVPAVAARCLMSDYMTDMGHFSHTN